MAEPYDVNYCFPVPERIENDRISLTPFIPDLHYDRFLSQAERYPEIFTYVPFGILENQLHFSDFVHKFVQPNPGSILFCIWDKTRPVEMAGDDGAFAGVIGLINSDASHVLAAEIGAVLILPPFHRTHVATNAVGLLLHYTLEVEAPAASSSSETAEALAGLEPDAPARPHTDVFRLTNGRALGIRRVVWQANVLNAPSVRLAERMGFTREATLRWDRALVASKPGNGIKVRHGDPKPDYVGRDTALLSLCWDDWEGGAREKVQQTMRRLK